MEKFVSERLIIAAIANIVTAKAHKGRKKISGRLVSNIPRPRGRRPQGGRRYNFDPKDFEGPFSSWKTPELKMGAKAIAKHLKEKSKAGESDPSDTAYLAQLEAIRRVLASRNGKGRTITD